MKSGFEIRILLLAVSLIGLAACGGGGGGGGGTPVDTSAPTVVATSPTDGSGSIPVDTLVTATFSEAVDGSGLISGRFVLADTGSLVPENGSISFNAATLTATFDPDLDLAQDTNYTATLAADIVDLAGNTMTGEVSWSFTTGPSPTVIATVPTDNATGVSVGILLSLIFSEAMEPASFFPGDLELIDRSAGDAPVAGTQSFDPLSDTLLFLPGSLLTAAHTYQATLRLGPTDLGGNPLPAEFVWTFSTASPPPPPPP